MESGIAAWLDPAWRDGQLEHAVACLEQASAQAGDRLSKAWSEVRLAALYALQGQSGLSGGLFHLLAARASYADIARTELYQALAGELAAYQGGRAATVRQIVRPVLGGNQAEAQFHAARALLAIGARNRASRLLRSLDATALPRHLLWRHWSLLGGIHSAKADWTAATSAYEKALRYLHPADGLNERLALAHCYLQLGKAHEAHQVLQTAAYHRFDEVATRLRYLRLSARTYHQLGNPNQALAALLQAYSEAHAHEQLSAELLLELARLYRQLGNVRLAHYSYEQARTLADRQLTSFIQHEHAAMLLENQQPETARNLLEAAAQDAHYPLIAEVVADLAECSLRLGDSKMANLLARCAHAAGAVVPAALLLAEMALESCQHASALEWLEQVVSVSQEGSSDWISAQLYLVEALAWAGPEAAERVIHHGELALRYLDRRSSWVPIVTHHVAKAKTELFGGNRLLN